MVDYSKWDHIEISDDEDETHPNIHTPSLHKWRHESRVERMEKADMERRVLDKERTKTKTELEEARQKSQKLDDKIELEKYIRELEKKDRENQEKEIELNKQAKSQPWNIDTMCRDGFDSTVVNINDEKAEPLTEEERMKKSQEFMNKHEENIKKYGMFSDFTASKDFLVRNSELVNEDTAGYLTLWCINLEVEEKHSLMERVAKQTICLNYILELGKQLKIDPRSCVPKFFERIKTADKTYVEAYEDEVKGFIERVKVRAQVRIDKAMKEYEEEERKKRLGPGGLDPADVMETLPNELKECFESQSIAKLHQVLNAMSKEDAEYHMKRCVDSGLWVADAKSAGLKSANDQLREEIEQNAPGTDALLAEHNITVGEADNSDDEHYEKVD
ncbi:Hsp90 co-chaperone Cdc37-like [Oopsacas minuta]|uniref:Hsp90 chaperone protein kinase-targeting subunit n=1 Tax=Oopsacas minuta TaxID=111878 RepID=A0AAV7KCX5_9METZ|nr:Hsp90 co-chaperone Cdc37-like [Oopsacas minuta]